MLKALAVAKVKYHCHNKMVHQPIKNSDKALSAILNQLQKGRKSSHANPKKWDKHAHGESTRNARTMVNTLFKTKKKVPRKPEKWSQKTS